MEEKRRPDRRILKTKRAIRNALTVLMTEKTYNEITIKEIADKADINRKTFYNYYRGIYEVVEEIENDLIVQLDALIDETDFRDYLETPSVVLKKINTVMNEDLDFYGHLFSLKDGLTLLQKVIVFFKEKTKGAILEQFPATKETDVELMLDFTLSGTLTVYHQWFNSNREKSLDEVSKFISHLAVNGIRSVVVQ